MKLSKRTKIISAAVIAFVVLLIVVVSIISNSRAKTKNLLKILPEQVDFEINGNVVITSSEGDKFTTDYLNYSDAEKKFFTNAPVTMENKRVKIKGTGLTLFINSGKLNLSSMVKAKIK